MSKAFTTETENDNDDLEDDDDVLPKNVKNYMTPAGHRKLQEEYQKLVKVERPKIVEIVTWAAGNGDRSENGDYHYGKKRLREIDRRIRYLVKRLENAEVVDLLQQQSLERVFFGATVTYVYEDGTEKTVTIVGIDETHAEMGKISWLSPLARALMKAQVGDEVELRAAKGSEMLEILLIHYKGD